MSEEEAVQKGKVIAIISVLAALIFSKYFYLASISSYYTFYLIDRFHLSIQSSQMLLFLFLFAGSGHHHRGTNRRPLRQKTGHLVLDPGRSSLYHPFAIRKPLLDLCVVGGHRIDSRFRLFRHHCLRTGACPGKVGMIGGVFYGLAFGMGGLGSAVLGNLADLTSITFVYHVCSFLPLIGLLTVFLPNLDRWVANKER